MSLIVLGTVALDNIKSPKGDKKDLLGGSAAHFSMSARLNIRVNGIFAAATVIRSMRK